MELEDNWSEIWFTLADGSQLEENAIRGMDIFEFFQKMKVWQDDAKKKLKNSQYTKGLEQ